MSLRMLAWARVFQSTLPVRGATESVSDNTITTIISIHAPREGSDLLLENLFDHLSISIHAPREGSDPA